MPPDKIVQALRANGVERMFADIGEPRVKGLHPRVGRRRAGGSRSAIPALPTPSRSSTTQWPPRGGYGFRFDRDGRFHHLWTRGPRARQPL